VVQQLECHAVCQLQLTDVSKKSIYQETTLPCIKVGAMKRLAIRPCARAVTLFRGLYARVADDLGVDPSYVSRIARGERKSKVTEAALDREFDKAVALVSKLAVKSRS
jgi:transcriptional regulator with XRE-family HTH domain